MNATDIGTSRPRFLVFENDTRQYALLLTFCCTRLPCIYHSVSLFYHKMIKKKS